MSVVRWLLCGLVLAAAAWGQGEAQYVPGRPWSAIVPDPDRYDWSQADRPGYRFRGMTPMQQRFHDYIQQKRALGTPLSQADRFLIRHLIAARRWPEAPRPNEYWAAYMRWLREQTTDELNVAQNLMLTELMAAGFVALDRAPNAQTQRLIDYLQSRPYECRNWFERNLVKVEAWFDYALANHGYALSPPAPGGNRFPNGGTFNGMSITYQPAGCTLTGSEDSEGFTTRRTLTGTFTPPCTLTVSGSVTVGGWGATLSARVWGGTEPESVEIWLDNKTGAGSRTFRVSVNLPADATEAGFSIGLAGKYSLAGAGSGTTGRGLVVTARLVPDEATREARRRAADEAWRRQVEETLASLGYSDTPDGQTLAALRDALAGSDADWRQYIDAQQQALGYDDDPGAEAMRQLQTAAEQGGEAWQEYVNRNVDDQGGDIDVGTSLDGDKLGGVANTFEQPLRLNCKLDFRDLPEGTVAVAVWYRDAEEFIRSEREVAGTGWVSFSILGGGGKPLAPGRYRLVVTAGERQLGWRNFTVK